MVAHGRKTTPQNVENSHEASNNRYTVLELHADTDVDVALASIGSKVACFLSDAPNMLLHRGISKSLKPPVLRFEEMLIWHIGPTIDSCIRRLLVAMSILDTSDANVLLGAVNSNIALLQPFFE